MNEKEGVNNGITSDGRNGGVLLCGSAASEEAVKGWLKRWHLNEAMGFLDYFDSMEVWVGECLKTKGRGV